MYCRYQINFTATPELITNDLRALITGEMNVNNLSLACDKNNSSMVTSVSAGWTLHDQVSTTKFVVKAKEANGVIDKFVMIEVTTSAIKMGIYETWNAVTHTGTNLAGNVIQSITSLNNPNTIIYLFVKPQYIIIVTKNDGVVTSVLPMALEITRKDPWNTYQNGYPAHVFCTDFHNINNYGAVNFYLPRLKNDGGDLVSTNAWVQLTSPLIKTGRSGVVFPFHPYYYPTTINRVHIFGVYRGENFNDILLPVMDFSIHRYVSPTYWFMGGDVLGGIKMMPSTYGNNFDVLTYNNKNYLIVMSNNDRNLISLLIPME